MKLKFDVWMPEALGRTLFFDLSEQDQQKSSKVLQDALKLYLALRAVKQNGGSIIIRDSQGDRELELPDGMVS